MSTYEIKDLDVPEGNYVGDFVGCEEVTHEEYGLGLRFEWQVTEGRHKGKSCYRTTSPEPTTKNACGAVMSALAGVSQSGGERVSLDDCIGRSYLLIVKKSPSGKGTRVHELILKDPPPADF